MLSEYESKVGNMCWPHCIIRVALQQNQFSGFTTRSNTNQAVQPQKMARGLKLRIYEVEGLYYLCSENEGADQLCGYRRADLRLCFCKCKKAGFLIKKK